MAELDAALEQMRPLDAQEVRLVLRESVGTAIENGWTWDAQFTNISHREEACRRELDVLDRVQRDGMRLRRLAELSVELVGSSESNLFGSPAEEASAQLVDFLSSEAEELQGLRLESDGLLVEHAESTASHTGGPVGQHFLALVLSAALESVDSLAASLRLSFRPNLGRAPMPKPYVVDLSGPHAVENARGGRYQINRIPGDVRPTPDVARVALLSCGVPETWYSHTSHYTLDPATGGGEALRDVLLDAISACAETSADVLICPEYFIPRAYSSEIVETARASGLTLIGGLEAWREADDRTVNEALVCLPRSAEATQRKQGPSVYELKSNRFASDGLLHVATDTVMGTTATVVCSDYLELDIVGDLARKSPSPIDVLVVCARNPKPAIFETLALADAVRLYSFVIVVNSCPSTGSAGDGQGTMIAAPRHENGGRLELDSVELPPLKVGESHIASPSLLVGELNLSLLRGREKRRVHRGWLPASNFATGG